MKKQKKAPIVERICRAINLPPEAVSRTPSIELHGRTVLKLRDGGKILLYTQEKIKVALPKSRDVLTVLGSGLSCSFYNLGAVGIEGKIDMVCFTDRDDEE